MLFRVTFSDNVNEYYKESPVDVQISVTVEAPTFKDAQLRAEDFLYNDIMRPDSEVILEMVATRVIENEEIEE